MNPVGNLNLPYMALLPEEETAAMFNNYYNTLMLGFLTG